MAVLGWSIGNYRPTVLNTTRIQTSPRTSKAALNVRISCVLGLITCHIKAQNDMISPSLSRRYIESPSIRVL